MLSALHIMLLEASPKINVEALLDKLANWGVEAGKDIIGAILIFVIGRFVIRQLNRLSAGVAVGMALSGNLSNFAGGLIILVFKPFKVGDYIDTSSADVSGTVKEIQIFHTVLATLDNKIIYVPNGVLSSNAIINYSKQNMRRAEWVIGVEYGEDVDKVKKVIESLIEADTRILKDPAPLIALKALSASSVDIVVRAWAKSEDYWNVYFDMNKNIYDTFNRAGIGFPFPQLTVHQAKD